MLRAVATHLAETLRLLTFLGPAHPPPARPPRDQTPPPAGGSLEMAPPGPHVSLRADQPETRERPCLKTSTECNARYAGSGSS